MKKISLLEWCKLNSRMDILEEFNVEKNNGITPDLISYGNSQKVWWKCKKGHEWQAAVNKRTCNHPRGCPICVNKQVLVGYNDLATTHPHLLKEWNYERNGDLKPTTVTYGSNKKVWWKCSKGHEWQTTVSDRANSQGCPICANKQVLVGYNDLATKRILI